MIRRLLKNERVGFINLCRRSSKYRVSDLFGIPTQSQSRLFIVYLKDNKEALVEYLASLIKRPLNKNRVRALSWRLRSLDDETRLKVIQRAGYDHIRKYDECVEEFLESGLKSARVNISGVKPQSIYLLLLKRIKEIEFTFQQIHKA